LLEGCIKPETIVDLEFLQQTDKKAYGGKRMIEMVQNILGFSKITYLREQSE